MSIQFSDTSTYKGLVQLYEKEIGANRADVSGNTDKLKEFTAEANIALDNFLAIAFRAGGTWQFDDSNHTNYPIIYTDLVSGQSDYSFTSDENSNLLLDIHKVAVLGSATDTIYTEIYPVDQQSQDVVDIVGDNTATGTPIRYDKTANGIFLDPPTSYNATDGLKVYISREGSYFTYTDTTKKAGVPGLFHKYFALKPAHEYCRRNSLASYNRLAEEVKTLEEQIEEYFGNRERDTRKIMSSKYFNFR